MKIRGFLVAALVFSVPSVVWADEIEHRIEALEKGQAELYHTLAGKKEAGTGAKISENVAMSGLVEVEVKWANVEEAGVDTAESDIELATAQIGFEATVTEELHAILILEFEEDGTSGLDVDEATVDYSRGPWFLRLGIQDLPSGHFPSHMISGPLTEDLGEVKETAILVGYEGESFAVLGWIANGDFEEAGDEDQIDDMGFSVMVAPSDNLQFGASYFIDMADTDAELLTQNYIDRVAGMSAFFVLELGGLEILGEHLGASDEFDPGDLEEDGDGKGDRPSAWNAEIAVDLRDDLELAVRIGGSSEWAGEPESQYGACVSYGVWENASLSFEYLHDEFDSSFSSEDSRDTVTTQLAVEF